MRKELQDINGTRKRFIGTFVRYGSKKAFKGAPITTLLFTNIRDAGGKFYSDHIWFTTTKGFEKYEFKEGDNVCFDARVKSYIKGYRGYREDDYEKLKVALGGLGPVDRELIVLSRYEGLKYAEIAKMKDVSLGSVKVQVHRALKELRVLYFKQ